RVQMPPAYAPPLHAANLGAAASGSVGDLPAIPATSPTPLDGSLVAWFISGATNQGAVIAASIPGRARARRVEAAVHRRGGADRVRGPRRHLSGGHLGDLHQ